MNDWYNRLNDYFPSQEMKSKKHFELLLSERKEFYKKEEGPEYIMTYWEEEEFIFIDYILVSGAKRGRGTGSKILSRLKRKNKPIILEVEPVSSTDPDTEKRIRFYKNAGFKEASAITYRRLHVITNELNEMNVFYWSSKQKTDRWVFEKMAAVYTQVHSYKAEEVYGKPVQPVTDVLSLKRLVYSKA